jgi:hypothetical protein
MAKDEGKTVKAERDAAAKAVIDNMAKLKAQRLAREALAPPVVAKKKKSAAATKPGSKSAEKTPALAAWLAGQQSGGRRT